MATRKEKVTQLMESFRSLKRSGVFSSVGHLHLPHITPAQWGALTLIQERGESTVKDVAEGLGVTSSAATQLVDSLVASRYIMRETSTKDRRIVRLILSKKTALQVLKMKKKVLQKFLKLFEMLDDKEFDQYLSLNKKIVDRFSKQ